MKPNRRQQGLNAILILFFISSLVGVPPVQAFVPLSQPADNADSSRQAGPIQVTETPGVKPDVKSTLAPDGLQYAYNSKTGKLSFVGGDAAQPLGSRAGNLSAQGIRSSGESVLTQYAADFGLKDVSKELRLAHTEQSNTGTTLRYQQQYNGIPVVGGEMLVNTDAGGQVLSLNGEVSPDLALGSTSPTITAEQARQAAVGGMKTWYGVDADKVSGGEPALWIYDPRILGGSDGPVALVWRMDVGSMDDARPVNELVLVDASTGQVALHFNQVDSAVSHQDAEPTGTAEPEVTETPIAEPAHTETPIVKPTETSTPEPAQERSTDTTPEAAPSSAPANVIQAQDAGTWYVATTGSDANDCATPFTPCVTINAAIVKAAVGSTVKIAVGTYKGSSGSEVVNITKSIELSGGWGPDFTGQSGFTTIDGETVRRGITITPAYYTIQISRFVVTRGYADKGSGLYTEDANVDTVTSLTIENCSFHHNYSQSKGAVYIYVKNLTMVNTTIGDNLADKDTGGLYLITNHTQAKLRNVTIARNEVKPDGMVSGLVGGIHIVLNSNTDQVLITNSIIANNGTNTSHPDCFFDNDYYPDHVTVIFSLLGNTSWCSFWQPKGYESTNIVNTDAKIGAITPSGIYQLLPNSLAIDSGDPALPGSEANACAAADQLGTARPIDGNQDGTTICDMGAYETEPPPPSVNTSISVNGGSPQTRILQQSYAPLSALVLDQYGLPVAGTQVTFTASSSGASGTFADTSGNQTTAITNTKGIATASILTANNVSGQFFVQASVAGVAIPAQFQLENYTQALGKVSVSAGNNQYAGRHRSFLTRLQARVDDNGGHPMAGIPVTFTALSSGATGTFVGGLLSVSVVTDANGVASAPEFTANGTGGAYTVTASVEGLSQNAEFTLTNEDLYVSPNGVDLISSTGLECTDPASPCRTIAYAVSQAPTNVGIFIESGTYTHVGGITTNSKTLVISGGWDAGFHVRVGKSILDGWNSTLSISMSGGSVEISGLILEYGSIGARGTILTIQDCALINSKSPALYTVTKATLIDTTISGSGFFQSSSSVSSGMGIDNEGELQLQNVTITGMKGKGIYNGYYVPSKITLQNSIIAGNVGDIEVSGRGSLISLGHNIFGTAPSIGYSSIVSLTSTDLVKVDPKLGPLSANSYHPLLIGSPAIDAIDPNEPGVICPATDQRGVARPFGSKCDIGAYEYISPSNPVALAVLSESSPQTVGPSMKFAIPFQVQALDSLGSPVSGVTVTFSGPSSGPGGTFADTQSSTTQVTTDENGIATSSPFTSNFENGRYTITASATGLPVVEFQVGNGTPALYVDATGSDYTSTGSTNNCQTSTQPCRTVSNALSQARPGDLINITVGNYYIPNNNYFADCNMTISLSGGWDSTFSSQTGRSVVHGNASNYYYYNGLYIRNWASVSVDRIDFVDGNKAVTNEGTFVFQNSELQNNFIGIDNLKYGIANIYNLNVHDSGNTGIINEGGMLSLQGGVFQNNPTGISIGGGSVKLMDIRIAGSNLGISNVGGNLLVKKATIQNNATGISNSGGSLELINININGSTSVGINNQDKITFTNGNISKGKQAVYNQGELHLINVTISDNVIYQVSSGTYETSSGIFNSYHGVVKLTNVTLTRNYTFLQNANHGSAAALYNEYGNNPIVLQNSIIARNQSNLGHDCLGNITSLGHNLIGNSDRCSLISGPGDLIGTFDKPLDPKLAELGDTGGTLTSALIPGSPAIDAGDLSTCPATDQRGAVRPDGNGCDIGAYEGIGNGTVLPQILVFKAANNTIFPGDLLCRTPQENCTNGADIDADKAYQFAAGIYSFFSDHLGWESLDNGGMAIVSTVHDNQDSNVAYWNGSQMIYSDGYSQADDVVGHEFTHAVTQYGTHLLNYYQSGAISESLSDLWGEYFDQTNGQGNDSSEVKWLIGEDLPEGAVRSISDPPAFNSPDKMTSPYYSLGWQDNGGIHINSGLNNKAVFLMVDGGTFNNRTVIALGWEKTSAIYYSVQTHLLTSGADYADLYMALPQACSVLIGTGGITATDCQQVRSAIDAVEMNLSPTKTYNIEAAACPSGLKKSPTNLFMDDFESGAGNWKFTTQIGNPHWGIAPGDVRLHYASSGLYALFGNDYDSLQSNQMSDSSAEMLHSIEIPSNADVFLYFKHSFGFEYGVGSSLYYFDGGMLEYTLDDGRTWKDAGGLISDGRQYSGSLTKRREHGRNPLGGRQAFVGESRGYVSSRVVLNSLAGKAVRFRWRIATDEGGSYLGWAVDDVSIYTCVSTPPAPALKTPAKASLLPSYLPRLDWTDVRYGDHYELQVFTAPSFSQTFFTATDIHPSDYTFTSSLPDNSTYYWNARAVNTVGQPGPWSRMGSFRTAMLSPGWGSPVDGTTLNTLRPTLTWTASPGADSYQLVISTAGNYSRPALNVKVSGSATTYIPTKDLPAGKKLYGRIMANGANPSAWTTFTFTTPVPPSVPVLVAPANNLLLTSTAVPSNFFPTLSWKAVTMPKGALPFDHYELQVSAAADFSSLLYPNEGVDTSRLITTSFQIPESLSDNQHYYWRVRACNQNLDCSWWANAGFRTALTTPQPSSPVAGGTITDTTPDFNWSGGTGADSYTIQVSANANLSSPSLSATVKGLAFTPVKSLPKGKWLYWRVRANGANGPSLWSTVQSFWIQ